MSNDMKNKKKKKMNSYLKIGLLMLVGAFFGAAMAIGFMSSEEAMIDMLQRTSGIITGNLFLIELILAVGTVIFCVFSYWKAENILKQLKTCDEEEEEYLDCRFEVWSTTGMMGSQIPMFVAMMLLGFIPMAKDRLNIIGTVISFIVLVIVSSIFQIAVIKQVQKKDPTKKGDPSDLGFEKKWLESCDEGERQIIYQAAYKTFNFMKYVLLVGLILALLAQFHWGAGITPLMFIGTIYIMMIVVYSIYSVMLQKSKLNN